jgi:hypothetical protein
MNVSGVVEQVGHTIKMAMDIHRQDFGVNGQLLYKRVD